MKTEKDHRKQPDWNASRLSIDKLSKLKDREAKFQRDDEHTNAIIGIVHQIWQMFSVRRDKKNLIIASVSDLQIELKHYYFCLFEVFVR